MRVAMGMNPKQREQARKWHRQTSTGNCASPTCRYVEYPCDTILLCDALDTLDDALERMEVAEERAGRLLEANMVFEREHALAAKKEMIVLAAQCWQESLEHPDEKVRKVAAAELWNAVYALRMY